MKKVAIILSGCGVFDGAEIHEAVLSMLAVRLAGAQYECFAPDIEQMHVVNHLTGEPDAAASRNVLVESARIARGQIRALTELDANDFDVLLVPGGFGAAKNLCDFAVNGSSMSVDSSVQSACQQFAAKGKAIGYACIAPAMISRIHGPGVRQTIGNDADTIAAISDMGGEHVICAVEDVILDKDHKIVTTPAYMLARSIDEAWEGIQKWVMQVLALAETHHSNA